jgi:putative membrane protein
VKIQDIPALNAALNALATVLITFGFVQIKAAQRATDATSRAARIRAHRALMLAAGGVSGVFLIGYVTHKILVRGVHTPFGGTGAIAAIYYAMLLSHILLAISIAYLVPRTFQLALRGDYDRHKTWARWTYPIWYYVSVTGVLVYFFLYQWWPPRPAEPPPAPPFRSALSPIK